MEKEELFDLLDGFFAYDEGFTDSGICDSLKKQEVRDYLDRLEARERNGLLFEFLNAKYMSKESLDAGYGIETVQRFCNWIELGF